MQKTETKKHWLQHLIGLILLVVLITYVQSSIIEVSGNSMYPTYHNGEKLWLDRYFSNKQITKGTVVVINRPADNREPQAYRIIKRVEGLPGDQIKINKSQFFINKKQQKWNLNGKINNDLFDYSSQLKDKKGNINHSVVNNSIFVMGDNRNNSYDSRYIGDINIQDVYGINPQPFKNGWIPNVILIGIYLLINIEVIVIIVRISKNSQLKKNTQIKGD